MAKIQEILQIEKSRDSFEDMCRIHIFQEGSFYRSYQMSAWLCVKYLHEFKINNHRFKSIAESVTFVGFPVSSLQKWMPDSLELSEVAEKHFCIDLISAIHNDYATIEGFIAEYNSWKEKLPIEESALPKDRNQSSTHPNITLSMIAQRIIAFPLEQKSPIDCMLFLSEVKKQLSSIF